MWQGTHDMWHVTIGGRWTFSKKFRSLAHTIWKWRCLQDLDEKDHSLYEWMIGKGVSITTPATWGLLNIYFVSESQDLKCGLSLSSYWRFLFSVYSVRELESYQKVATVIVDWNTCVACIIVHITLSLEEGFGSKGNLSPDSIASETWKHSKRWRFYSVLL